MAAAAATIGLIAAASPASAAGWGAFWEMDGTAKKLVDWRNGNTSTNFGAGITPRGEWYDFTGKGAITVQNSSTLRPFDRGFIVEANVDFLAGGDRNVVQKGQYSAKSTQYKLEVVGDDLSCQFKGSKTTAYVRAVNRQDVINRKVFTLVQCRKTAGEIAIKVGTEAWITKKVSVGSIGTDAPLTIGGKINCKSCDYFSGRLEHVSVRAL